MQRTLNYFAIKLLFWLACGSATASELRVMTANLHGFHPYGASERVLEDRSGRRINAPAHPFYFRIEELSAGKSKRARVLAAQIESLNIDIVFMQEVAGGNPFKRAKNCEDFKTEASFWSNSASEINQHLRPKGYDLALACRGNIGWMTNKTTFQDQRVLRHRGETPEVVFDFGDNPYPNGILVEGFALLVKRPLKIASNQIKELKFNSAQMTVKFQITEVYSPSKKNWLLAVNVHLGHKVAHFEQSVAIRNYLQNYLRTHPRRSNFAGLVVAGDFNARLFEGVSRKGEISALPWQLFHEGGFDFRLSRDLGLQGRQLSLIRRQLAELNNDRAYKPWASISSPKFADMRIADSLSLFKSMQTTQSPNFSMFEALRDGRLRGACLTQLPQHSSCSMPDRIDHIFASRDHFKLKSVGILDHDTNYQRTDRFSDHPLPIAVFNWQNK